MSETNENGKDRTREEKLILQRMARKRDPEWVKENEELILAQARKTGEL